MDFQRYFKPEQQLLLRVAGQTRGRTELLTGYVVCCDRDEVVVSLPYGIDVVDQYPFGETVSFEISSEAFGMGIRTGADFAGRTNGSQFVLKLHSDLQMFKRRISPRLDCQLAVRFSRPAKTLQTMRDIWERNLEVLRGATSSFSRDGFARTKVNISTGGIRLAIDPPADQGELCLVLVDLDDGSPPLCAVTEIVWSCAQNETTMTAGMRFINILGEDQQRIDIFIAEQKKSE
jgi:hypothetical protein